MNNKQIKINDKIFIKRAKGNKNVYLNHLFRVARALPIVIKKMLLQNHELIIENFVKMSVRIAKDRVLKSWFTGEKVHMPQHLRFKAYFLHGFKKYLNM